MMIDSGQNTSRWRKVPKMLVGVLLVYLIIVALAYFSQRKLMYVTHLSSDISAETVPPEGFRKETVTTPDGLTLYGWYSPPKKGRPVTVWFHGNGSNILWHSERAKVYRANGFGVLLVEYRGYSNNEGKPTEDGLYADADAWMLWLKSKDIPENKTILYAESLGTGIAIQMALEYPDIAAMVLESPYTSMVDVARKYYWFAPIGLLLKDRFDNLSKISDVKSPLIFVHGTRDTIVPLAQGKQLYEAATSKKVFIELDGANHLDLALPEYGVDTKVFTALSKFEAL